MIYPGPAAEDLARIPQRLKAVKQWVLWKGVWRPNPPVAGQKPTKIPINVQTLTPADVTDPLTWGSYDTCVSALPTALEEWTIEQNPAYWAGGIGVVLTPEDDFVGGDLDGCVDPVTGHIAPWATEIVTALATYTELSPSATGLRFFAVGTLPPRGRRKGAIEIYTADRFLTLTGWHLDESPTTIEPRQTQLDNLWCTLFAPQVGDMVWTVRENGDIQNTQPLTIAAIAPAPSGELYARFVETSTGHPLIRCEKTSVGSEQAAPLTLEDEEIVHRINSASNAAKVTALARGDWTQDYPSQSEADLALCCHLAFWTRDAAQIDRLFRTTGLMRTKWDTKRGAQTYGARTIAEALARQTTHYAPPPTLVVPLSSSRDGQAYTWGTPWSRNGSTPHPPGNTVSAPAWLSVLPAPTFAQQIDTVEEALVNNLVMPQEITVVVAPRGEGKSVWTLFLAITAAKGGTFRQQTFKTMRVLLVDRDNSNREIRNRLRHFGVDGADNFKILTRTMGAPSLLDQHAWQSFPVLDYDLVIIDSLASATEGVSEKEGKLTQQVLATLKDVARQGPAILCLDNTVKSGEYHRGRNELAAAVDILYEVRDVTGWAPADSEFWWESLPDAGEQAWTSRLTRRNKHPVRRLAFMPTKFRSAAEPEPFIIEIDFTTEPWSLREVTAEVLDEAATEARVEQANQQDLLRIAAQAFATYLRGVTDGSCLKPLEAELFLRQQGLNRRQARNLLDAEDGTLWKRRTISAPGRGIGFFALPYVDTHTAAARSTEAGDPQESLGIDTSNLAVSLPSHGEKTACGK